MFRALLAATLALCFALAGCGAGQVDIATEVLDSTLYKADNKAERLIRYFELQALIVRFVASSGGSNSERNSVALANIAASTELTKLTACLRVGSVRSTTEGSGAQLSSAAVRSLLTASPDEPVRGPGAYCAFFDSRVRAYEGTLKAMIREAARNDPDAKLLASLIGGATFDFATVVTNLIQIAGRVIADVAVFEAFKTDAVELRYFIYQDNIRSPSQIDNDCTDRTPPNCASGTGAVTGNPTIRVWHFQEVEAYMKSACDALNGDAPTLRASGLSASAAAGSNCSANMPFPLSNQTAGVFTGGGGRAIGSGGGGSSGGSIKGSGGGSSAGGSGIGSSGGVVGTVVEPPAVIAGAETAEEKKLKGPEFLEIKHNILCIPDKRLVFDAEVRSGLKVFYENEKGPAQGRIDREFRQRLDDTLSNVTQPCPAGLQNWVELLAFTQDGVLKPDRIVAFQQWLSKVKPERSLELTGALDTPTRDRIAQVRDLRGKPPPDPLANKQVTKNIFFEFRLQSAPASQ